jgi:Kdo2-lipid IVA lauroyltransferase/acyltransferase
MKYIEYLTFRAIKTLLSIVPFKLLYALSNVCSLILQYVIKYRFKTIRENLRQSFPIKSNRRIRQITRQYYKYLCDVSLESIKGYSTSTAKLLKRYHCVNPELTNHYFDKGQSIIIALSHYGNWEWGTQVASSVFKHDVATFYKPMSNKYIDEYMQNLRMLRGMELLSIYETHRITQKSGEKPKAYFMVSDQSPGNPKKAHWMKFLNQDTACMRGIESYARIFNLPVIYLDIQRQSRGYYTVEMQEICNTPSDIPLGGITEAYMKKLEKIIEKKTEYWLWSHRRWKMKK